MVRFVWPGWCVLLLVGLTSRLAGQGGLPPPRVELRESYPNPLYPATMIPFEIRPEVCSGGHQPVVSLKIFNVLVQVVAVPVLQGSGGERLDNLRLRCGAYGALWDWKYLDGRREAATGVYYYQLTVDGERYTRKMLLTRASEPQ